MPYCRLVSFVAFVSVSLAALAGDWPQWGGDDARNMVCAERGRPASFEPGKKKPGGGVKEGSATNVKWAVRLGTKRHFHVFAHGRQCKELASIRLGSPMYGTAVAANGVLYVASNRYLWAVCQR
ncbi:MAG: hypothetical protein ACODAJ_01275 [Planctomycetota bacterium]